MEIFYCICHGSNTHEFLGVNENLLYAAFGKFKFENEYGFTNTKRTVKGHGFASRKEPLLVVAREAQL